MRWSEAVRRDSLRYASSAAFMTALAGLLEEVPAEGFLTGECGEDLKILFRAVEEGLAARGLALRNARLRAAAAKIRSGDAALAEQIVFDGFFTPLRAGTGSDGSVGGPELGHGHATGWQAVRRLTAAGFAVQRFSESWRAARRVMFSAATPEREAEEIARRILEHVAKGRRFREMGIVLRSRDPYGPLIETTLARFGIPARSYFTDPLASPSGGRISVWGGAGALGGWDHARAGQASAHARIGHGSDAGGRPLRLRVARAASRARDCR